jgi:hypothetical protein
MLNASEKRAEEELLPDLSWTGGGFEDSSFVTLGRVPALRWREDGLMVLRTLDLHSSTDLRERRGWCGFKGNAEISTSSDN